MEFFCKMTVVSDNKRLSKEEFTAFEVNLPASARNSHCTSTLSFKDPRMSHVNDESSLNKGNSSTADLSSKIGSKDASKMNW